MAPRLRVLNNPAGPRSAYLDIETSFARTVTVVGLLTPRGFHQWIGRQVAREPILEALDGLETLVTFNGDRFDLPVLRRALGVDLRSYATSHDLLRDCWQLRLYGGLKVVERRLGIARTTSGVDGYEAMRLWERYVTLDDTEALARLKAYNREDVMNLPMVEAKLRELDVVDASRGAGLPLTRDAGGGS